MIQEETVTLRKQTPEAPNEWLYETVIVDGEEKRKFKPFVYLGRNANPWPECTNEEKEQWEEEHKPEPIEPEHPQPETIEPEEAAES